MRVVEKVERMINLKISGRGGNQFFQYAYVQKYIDEHCPNEIMNISFEYLEDKKTDETTFVNVLKEFNIKKINEISKVKYNKKQKFLDYLYRFTLKLIRIKAKAKKRSLEQKDYDFMKKILQKTLNRNGLYYYIPGENNYYESKTNNIIFFGSYEDSATMDDYRDEILKYYKVTTDLSKEARAIFDIATNTNSVCVTIRRGDFLLDKHIKNYFICDNRYFVNAIKKMNDLIKNPQYIVFSDDVEWCKDNMNFPENTVYENVGNTICEKIQIMSACKHFIISNSTFSWWAQFLGEYSDKKVIAPRKWNNFEYSDLIYQDDWTII